MSFARLIKGIMGLRLQAFMLLLMRFKEELGRRLKVMKKRVVKFSSLMMAILMSLSMLTACGGATKMSKADIPSVDAEPNAGIRGIVYTVPEGWKQINAELGRMAEFGNDDTEYNISIYVTTEEDIKEADGEDKNLSVKEYYDKHFAPPAKVDKESAENQFILPICDTEGLYAKLKGDDGNCYSASASWFLEDTIYNVYLGRWENYDENGLKDDAKPASDSDLAALESLLGSVKAGDGEALQTDKIDVDTIGSLRFELPEGFEVKEVAGDYMTIKKVDGEPQIQFYVTTEDTLNNMTDEDGNSPKTLQEAYEMDKYEGQETYTIAGKEGLFSANEEEEGIFSAHASVLLDDGIYSVNMFAAEDMWDDNGYRKSDVKPLTDGDIKAFKDLVSSLTQK